MSELLLNEDEQVEAIKRWWNKYGTAIILGVVLGIIGVLGYQYWQKNQHKGLSAASSIYLQMIDPTTTAGPEIKAQQAAYLKKNYPNTIYASMASLSLAKTAVVAEDLATATTELQWALSHAKPGVFKDITRIRLARIQAAQGDVEKALKNLDQVNDATFKSLAADVRGDLLLKQGDMAAAKKAYQTALSGPVSIEQLDNLINLKLANLVEKTT